MLNVKMRRGVATHRSLHVGLVELIMHDCVGNVHTFMCPRRLY